MTWLPSQKRGGMTVMTGVLQWMAINSSEGIGKEREVVGWHCMLGTCFDCIKLNNCDDKVECLWVKMRGKANKADNPAGDLL